MTAPVAPVAPARARPPSATPGTSPDFPERGADLRVVAKPAKRPSVRVRRRRAAAALVVTGLAIGALLFTVVAAHVAVTQNQFRLQRLERRAAEQKAEYDRLRLQVAELEAPERVVAEAQGRLGMVQPERVTYLSPPVRVVGKSQFVAPAEGGGGAPVAATRPHTAGR